jgi:hypothetical protein
MESMTNTLISIIGTLMVCLFGILIFMVQDVRKELKDKVDKTDCNRIMDKLEDVVKEHHA